MEIKVRVERQLNGIKVTLKEQKNLGINLKDIVVVSQTETYKGSYEVTPQVGEQILETKDKLLKENVTIQPIPFYEVDNLEDGQTVIIGGNIIWQ